MKINEIQSELLREHYFETVHPSGLKVIVFNKPMAATYCIIGTKFGAVNTEFRIKQTGETVKMPDGVAHFLEHKLFENADGEDSFVKFGRLGADANAYTGFNSTCYLFSCNENVYDSLEVLLRTVYEPYFTDENVKKEQGIIGQEILMGEDDPGSRIYYNCMKLLYHECNVRNDIAGTVDSISKITPELLSLCHSAYYDPSNMVLCVCGDVGTNEVLAVCDRVLDKESKPLAEDVKTAEPPDVAGKNMSVSMEIGKGQFCIGIKNKPADNPYERLRYSVICEIMSELYFGTSSEFSGMLYESGLSTSQSYELSVNDRYSYWLISGDSNTPKEVFDRFGNYARGIRGKVPDPSDFEIARRVLYSEFVRKFDSTSEIANEIIECETDGIRIFDYADIINDLHPQDIADFTENFFDESKYVLSEMYPIGKEIK